MNFGKLHDISGVDFTLPPDSERTLRVLARAAQNAQGQLKVFIGATGWGNNEWLGIWYPARTKPIDFLEHYSRQFNTIEFNMTHYRIPDADMVDRWRIRAAEGFLFCPKLPQQISHRARLRAEEPTLRFAEVMAGLGRHLGPCFIQLPDHHGPKDVQRIQEFLGTWPSELPLHWELRHRDWFGEETDPEAVQGFDALEEAGHGTVITDVAGRRDVAHMQLTNPVLMLRFVGNGLHPTDYARTDAWIDRIHAWSRMGLQEAYIFIHQPEMTQVPAFTTYWIEGLNHSLGLNLQSPKPVLGPVQGTLF